jgi:type I restriction enzyme, R subunit
VTLPNQNPEQIARDQIDKRLVEAGWIVQDKKAIDLSAGLGIAVREYQTDIGPADYVLFVAAKAVGVIEAKPNDWGHKITMVEEQSGRYAAATLKWVNNKEPLPFVYESTGIITRFTDGRDPKPRSREVFLPPARDHGRMVIKANFTSLASPDLAAAWSFWLTGLPDHGDRKSGKILQG